MKTKKQHEWDNANIPGKILILAKLPIGVMFILLAIYGALVLYVRMQH